MSHAPKSRPPSNAGVPKRNGQEPLSFGHGALPEGATTPIQFGTIDPAAVSMAGQPSQTPLHQLSSPAFGGSPHQGSHQRSPQQSVPHAPHGQQSYGPRATPPSPQQPTGGARQMYQGQPAGYYPRAPYPPQAAAYPAAPYAAYGYPAGYNPYQSGGYMYYGQPGAAVPQQQQQAPPARSTPQRKSHAIQIIDPNTGKEVDLKTGHGHKDDKHDTPKEDAGEPAKKDDEPLKADEEEAAKHEAEEKAKTEEEDRLKKEEEEKKQEEERLKREEEEKQKKEEEERLKKEEDERVRKEEEERKTKEDEERLRKEEEERLKKEEEERKQKEEEERLKKEEEERLKKEEEERIMKEEEERKQKEEEERKLAEEMERLRLEDEEKKRKEEEETRLRAEEEEKKRKEEEERRKLEEEEKKRKAEEEERAAREAKEKEDAAAKPETPEEAPAKAPVKLPTYAPGNWSPENPEGKRVYPLELLMAFMELVTKRPEGQVVYPEVDRVLAAEQAPQRDAGHGGGPGRGGMRRQESLRQMQGGYRQAPGQGDFRGPAGQGMRREPSLGGRGRGPRGGPGMMGPMPVRGPMGFGGMPGHPMMMRPPHFEPVEKIKIGENAWRPTTKPDPTQVDDPEQKEALENELLYRKLKGLLNKLTIDKFDRLTDQIMALEINNSTRLKGAIYIVFDKALDEPTFSPMYAQLCLRMSKWEIPGEGEEGKPKNTFRRHLLNKCQDEFEKEREFTFREGIAAEDEDEAVVRAKLRMLGNIKFIGELFKLDMLTDKIMHQCVWRLLQPKPNSTVPAEESLESLCQLMSTIGKKLDVPKARDHMNAYFDRIKHLVEKKEEIPSRIRFLMQDLIELRESNWVPRRAEAQAKTLEQVHKEMQQEQANKVLARSQSQTGRQDSQRLGRHDSRPGNNQFGPGGRGGPQPSADGWTAVGGSGRQNKPSDLGALRSMQSRAASTGDSTNVTLGPAGRGGMGARGWGLPRSGSGKGEQAAAPVGVLRNQFDILNSTDAGDDNKGPTLRPNMPMLRPQAPSPKNLRPTTPATASAVPMSSTPSPAPSPKPGVSEEEFKKKTKATVEEYYSIKDLKEAVTCFKELESPQLHKFIVEALFSVVDDNKKRPEAASLLVKLADEGLITRDDILNGLNPTFEQLDDLSMDIPKLHEYMAQYLTPLVQSGRVALADLGKNSHLEEAIKDLMSIAPAKMFAAILTQLNDEELAKKLWTESGLQWTSLLPDGKTPEDFLQSHNLAYLAA